ncbi:MAG: reverse transcriptase domain-containing protein, partial [Verrucomicrobiota bacterium]|nr:reverse transcriptase domain-containing protein [Verrucomicrobiota bacterium]
QSALRIASLSIVRTITGAQKTGTLLTSEWGQRFSSFCDAVSTIVSRGEFCFVPPTIQLVRKGTGRVKTMDEDKKRGAYRCISKFDKLEDRVILGKTATYLRDIFDSEFLDCCYAFRRNGRKFSFKKAVENLIAYRQRFSDKPLYVADCDVQKFFDVINHQVIRNAYESFVQRLGDGRPDARAGKILDAYLEAYSFPQNLEKSSDLDVLAKRDYVERVPEDVLASLYPDCDLLELRLGVPQGGALSPLLANMVMDAVDRAVLSGADEDLFYARFCDDMIIVHPNRRKCEEALNRYLNAMRLLKLPIHKLCKKPRYSASYFTEKSKGPVAWKHTSVGLFGTNWVNFLGYQIRYDGVVRVRKETVKKHQERLLIEKEVLFRNLKKAKGQYRFGKDWKDLFKVFQLRIAAMGVGRVDVNTKVRSSRSWLSVFRKNIESSGPAMSQMKNIDRTRSGILANVKDLLKSAWRNAFHATSVKSKNDSANTVRMKKGYLGAPFSYYGSLKSLERPSLSDEEIDDESNIVVYGDL